MADLGGPALVVVFGAGAAATWLAGISLARATDALDTRLGLGSAVGGLVLLAIAGSLPELAITVSAALSGHLDLAAGNLIGGIAMQTLVLAICDRAVRGPNPLTYLVGSLMPVLEGLLVVAVTGVMLLGTMLPSDVSVGPWSPASIAIVVVWTIGLVVTARLRGAHPWTVTMPGSRPGRRHVREPSPAGSPPPYATLGTGRIVGVFAVASLVTLVAGVGLEASGSAIAGLAGLDGVVFGATFLALATALPEISSGLAAVRLGDHALAIGDIFGGNAFQLCLFVVADLLAGGPVLPHAGTANAWLGGLAIVMTVVYAAAIIIRFPRRFAGFGVDSIAATAVYAIGVLGLIRVATG